jgi:sigma-B regulation protein RsbU (phosphoserine phosphatase)
VQEAIPLGELLTRLNRYSCEHSLEGRRFTTAVIAELDPASGTLTYVNAGHNPPALLRSTGAVEWLESGGLPLGIQAEAEYRPGTLTLDPGDRLMVYTDGVVEARNAREEEFGLARLTDCLRDGRGADSAGALARLMASLEEFVGGSGRDDDITCMVVSYSRP